MTPACLGAVVEMIKLNLSWRMTQKSVPVFACIRAESPRQGWVLQGIETNLRELKGLSFSLALVAIFVSDKARYSRSNVWG